MRGLSKCFLGAVGKLMVGSGDLADGNTSLFTVSLFKVYF